LINGPVCEICGVPENVSRICPVCQKEKPRYSMLRSWAVFVHPVQDALHRLKYRRDIGLGDALAAHMVGFVAGLDWPIDMIVPIPLGKKRLNERGYDQVGLVARPLAMALGLEYASRELRRRRETRSQVGLSKTARLENVRDAFVAGQRVRGKTVLVVDDVATTGSTLSSAADAFFASGAKDVYGLTVARALPRHGLDKV
jgi:ComF family protein